MIKRIIKVLCVDLVEEEEGAHGVGVGGVEREGAEEHDGVVAGVDDGFARAHALRDAAGHHAVEHLLQVRSQAEDLHLHEKFLAGLELMYVAASEQDKDLQEYT